MITLIIIVHIIICLGLIGIVLIQRGRGAGLVESFAGVESMFGTKTSAFLTRATTILSILFFVTCLSLAILSVRQSRSLMRNIKLPASVSEQPQKASIPEQPQAQLLEQEQVQPQPEAQPSKQPQAQLPQQQQAQPPEQPQAQPPEQPVG